MWRARSPRSARWPPRAVRSRGWLCRTWRRRRPSAISARPLPLPLVADIHFDYRLAICAAENGAAKIRINPGNIGGEDRVRAVVEPAARGGIPHPRRRERRQSRAAASGKVRPPHAGGAGRKCVRAYRAAGKVRFPRHLRVDEIQLRAADDRGLPPVFRAVGLSPAHRRHRDRHRAHGDHQIRHGHRRAFCARASAIRCACR